MGLPGTIDNDIYSADVSVGFNTAVNIAVVRTKVHAASRPAVLVE